MYQQLQTYVVKDQFVRANLLFYITVSLELCNINIICILLQLYGSCVFFFFLNLYCLQKPTFYLCVLFENIHYFFLCFIIPRRMLIYPQSTIHRPNISHSTVGSYLVLLISIPTSYYYFYF